MHTDGTPTSDAVRCVLGLTSEELSTWLAGGLDEPNTRRVGEHVSTCSACQVHLAAYTSVDTALRSQWVPYDANSMWERLRSRLLQTEQQTHMQRVSSGWRAGIAGFAAVAAILLLVVGFFQLFRNQSSITPSLTPAPTLVPAPLDWKAATFPAGSVLAYGHTLAIPSSDGNTAYVCAIASSAPSSDTPSGVASIWVSHDRATHWTQAHALPAVGHAANSCYIIVDDYQPSKALVVVSWSQAPIHDVTPDTAAGFVTTDGGASWHTLADPRVFGVARIATINGQMYAQIYHPCNASLPASIDNDCLWHLTPITDSWQIGHPVDQVIMNDSLMGISSLWVGPNAGEIWAEVPERHATISRLWKTIDGGAHWQQLKTPVLNGILGQRSADGHTLYLCGFKYAGTDPQNPQNGPYKVYCSDDGGTNWRECPLLAVSSKSVSVTPFTVTSDRSILQVVTDGGMRTLYRLTPTSTQWQSLGKVPGSRINTAFDTASLDSALLYRGGVFWVEPISPATFVPTLSLNDAVFTAGYP